VNRHLKIMVLELGPLQTNCYILADEYSSNAVVIDPGYEGRKVGEIIQNNNWNLEKILLTHGHFDHIGGVNFLQSFTKADVWIHPNDECMLSDPDKNFSAHWGTPYQVQKPYCQLQDGINIRLGREKIEVLHTPGHSHGSVAFMCDNFVIVGDTLFNGSVGRTDFPGSSHKQLISSIQKKLLVLSDELIVYPGHGPSTTIGKEKNENPFLA